VCAVVGGQQQLYFYPPQQGANNVVESITVEFESAVSGLTISNFALSKNGVDVPLTAAQYSSSSSHITLIPRCAALHPARTCVLLVMLVDLRTPAMGTTLYRASTTWSLVLMCGGVFLSSIVFLGCADKRLLM